MKKYSFEVFLFVRKAGTLNFLIFHNTIDCETFGFFHWGKLVPLHPLKCLNLDFIFKMLESIFNALLFQCKTHLFSTVVYFCGSKLTAFKEKAFAWRLLDFPSAFPSLFYPTQSLSCYPDPQSPSWWWRVTVFLLSFALCPGWCTRRPGWPDTAELALPSVKEMLEALSALGQIQVSVVLIKPCKGALKMLQIRVSGCYDFCK